MDSGIHPDSTHRRTSESRRQNDDVLDVALITGAGSGIGRAIAKRLGAAGLAVAVNDVIEQRAREVAGEVRRSGGSALAVPGDVSQSAVANELVDRVLEEFGSLTKLVNNAGIVSFRSIAETHVEEWDRVMTVNLRAVATCCQAAMPVLRSAHDASIVNIASTAAFKPKANRGPYPASKAGVVALTQQLALEWGPYGIRVNAIAPGRIAGTGMTGDKRLEPNPNGGQARGVPLGRVGRPEDVAAVVEFLLSDKADFMTGAVLVVDGGSSLVGPAYDSDVHG